MPGRELNFKLYIEGIEVPFINATINATSNMPSACRITMVPSAAIWDVRPRSLVHMFFKDDYIGPEPDGKFQSEPVWRLLWEGEIIGIGYGKAPGQRHVFLDCTDLSNYWDYTKQHFISSLRHGLSTTQRNLFFGTTQAQYAVLDKIITWYERFFKGEPNLATGIVKMVKGFTEDLVYWEKLNTRLHLSDKIFAVRDLELPTLIESDKIRQVLDSATGQLGGSTSLRTLINTIKEIVYYTHVPIVAPPFRKLSKFEIPLIELGKREGTTISFLFKPNIYMTTPPKCNVLFPDQITSINYSRSFLEEPTRLSLSANHVLTDLALSAEGNASPLQNFYYAPAQLSESIVGASVTIQNLNGRKLSETDKLFVLTEEEYEKGLIPVDIKLPYAKYSSVATSGNTKTIRENFQKIAEYQLQLYRFTPRTLTVVSEFNPWIVVGFPCAVFDANRSYFANVVNISHTIDSTGGSATQISCNLAREIVIDDEEVPTLPSWLNKRYHPDAVGGDRGTYMQILGCDALSSSADVSAANFIQDLNKDSAIKQEFQAETQFNIAKIANKVFQLEKPTITNLVDITGEYDLAATNKDAYQFTREYQRRSVATIAEIFGQVYDLGVKESLEAPVSVPVTSSDTELATGTELEGTPFDYRPRAEVVENIKTRRKKNKKPIGNLDTPGHKREPIIRYMKETKELRGLDGS